MGAFQKRGHFLSPERAAQGNAHSRQAKANSFRCSFPGSAWERFPRWLCNLRTEQAAEPQRTRSQAEPGNEHRSEFALSLTAMGFSLTLFLDLSKFINFQCFSLKSPTFWECALKSV